MLVNVAALTAAALAARMMTNPASKSAARGVTMTCQEKFCAPTYQILVDSPQNTLMRDDRPTEPTIAAAYKLSKHTYYTEAHEHPGVRLVAHTVM